MPVLFTFYIQCVLKLKKNNSGAKRLIQCVLIVHDKTKKAECEKSLRGGPQFYETLGAGAMDVANYQAAKRFGALPN